MVVYGWCVLCLCGVLVALWSVTSRRRRPPLARGALPLLGHLPLLLKDHTQLYYTFVENISYDAVRRGLSAITVRFGVFDCYVILNPDDALLLLKSYVRKDKLYDLFQPILNKEGLITAEGSVWKRHRKLLNPTFNQRVLNNYLVEINKHSRSFVDELAKYVGNGKFEYFHITNRFIVNMIISTIMGENTEDDREFKDKCFECLEKFTVNMVQRFQKFWLQNDFIYGFSSLKKQQDYLGNTLIEITYKMIDKRRTFLKTNNLKYESGHSTFLDYLLDMGEEGELTDSEIREEVTTFLAAGSDTTNSALAFVMLTIGTYPDVQQKILDELNEVFGDSDRDVDKQDIQKLKYMEAVIKETMRLYPSIFMISRVLEKEVVFEKYTLPAGSTCMIALACILRHGVWGRDAEQFRPERWLAPAQLPPAHAFAAFGLGKRSCIGSNYAIMVMKTTLVHLLRQYRISGDVTKLVQKLDVVLKPTSGCSIEIEHRRPQDDNDFQSSEVM